MVHGAIFAATWGLVVSCGFDAQGLGNGGSDGSGGATVPTTTSGGSSATGAGPTASGGVTSGSTGGADPTGAATTSGTTSEGTSSSSGGSDAVLVDRGVLVRYYLDESDREQRVTEVIDATLDPLNLPLVYSSDPLQPVFFEQGGNRGLEWQAELSDGSAQASIDMTKVEDALEGATEGTIEVVADVDMLGMGNDTSRFVAVGNNTEQGDFALVATVDGGFLFRVNDSTVLEWQMDIASMGRFVVHAVLDTSLGRGTDRARLYLDGVLVEPTSGSGPDPDEVISVENMDDLIIGNVSNEGRSPDGRIYYAAMYQVALTAEEVATNAAVLAADDDTP